MNIRRISIKDNTVNLINDKIKTLDIHRTVLGINGNLQVDIVKGSISITPFGGILKCEEKGGDYWTQIYHCETIKDTR